MNHIKQVADRLRGLRDSLDLTVGQMAEQCEITPEPLATYESGTADIPVSFLHRLASTYGVELTALMFGEEPTMNSYYVTRSGKGVKVERTKAYSYQDLASGFQHRVMAPFMVTIEPTEAGHPMTLNTHQGQEFNYVIEGQLEIRHLATKPQKSLLLFHSQGITSRVRLCFTGCLRPVRTHSN